MLMKFVASKRLVHSFYLGLACLLILQCPCFGYSENERGTQQYQYLALPLTNSVQNSQDHKTLDRYGIPFLDGSGLPSDRPAQVDVGGTVKRIFLRGMFLSADLRAWADPRDYSVRFFVGDELGQIRLNYDDGSTQIFPMILGESVWWGPLFYQYQEPFPTDTRLRNALAAAMHLYPPAPVEDGNYVAVITPKPLPIRSMTIENSTKKKSTVMISGITVESAESNKIAGAISLPAGTPSAQFEQFVREKSLRLLGEHENEALRRLTAIRQALYTSNENFLGHVSKETPPGYSGPDVSFKGDTFAAVLENAFRYNIQDIRDKVDEDGTYHTSTKGAVSWGGRGFGTFRKDTGMYYSTSWTRDMGRSLEELTDLGYMKEGSSCAGYCLRTAHLWEKPPALMINGQFLPPHWGRIANKPNAAPPYENDGHGLVTLFLYKYWQHLPNRDEWLRSNWADVSSAGDWILWEFDHPEISGAANGVLHTTGESAAGNGYSVYADDICLDALQALAQIADSIGETQSASRWRSRAEKMQEAISKRYITLDPKYGRVWTLNSAGWPNQSTVLGPLIFLADYQGFAPEDDNPNWRPVNEATYQRLVDTYQPFGFYGQAMGYGQGFVTESALLLDRMHDATQMLDWTAKEIYDPRIGSYVVPEGVQIDPTGRFWYRAGDLGNGVQEAEIIKTLRMVIGADDTHPDRLRLFPRMPYDWNEITVEKYPVLFEREGKVDTAFIHYKLERSADRMKMEIGSDKDLGLVSIRLGPFQKQPDASSIRINERLPAQVSVEHSGDSWWARFTTAVGPREP